MTVRPFREADRDALHRLTLLCFSQVSLHVTAEEVFGVFRGLTWQQRKTDDIDADCAANPEGVLVATEGEEVVGFITTRLDPKTGIGAIHNLAVHPDRQGQGIGALLLRAALAYLVGCGMNHARIETLEQNLVGRHLYPRAGFREIGRQIHYMMRLPHPEADAPGARPESENHADD